MDEKRFQEACDYFCEQSGYDSIDDFINDYGYMIESIDDYFYEDNPKQGMDDLYWDTIGARHRIQRYKKRIGFEDEPIVDPDDDEEDLIDRVEHEYRIVQKAETSGNFVSDYLIIDLKDDSRVYIPSSLEALKNIEIGACEETLAKVAVNKDGGLSVICSSYSGQIGEIDNLPNEIIDLSKSDLVIFESADGRYLVLDKNSPILIFYANSKEELIPDILIEKMESEKVDYVQLEETNIVSIRVNGKEISINEVSSDEIEFKNLAEQKEIPYEVIRVIGGDLSEETYKNGIKININGKLLNPIQVKIKDTGFKGSVIESEFRIDSTTDDILVNHNSPMHNIEYTLIMPDGELITLPEIIGLDKNQTEIQENVIMSGVIKDETKVV